MVCVAKTLGACEQGPSITLPRGLLRDLHCYHERHNTRMQLLVFLETQSLEATRRQPLLWEIASCRETRMWRDASYFSSPVAAKYVTTRRVGLSAVSQRNLDSLPRNSEGCYRKHCGDIEAAETNVRVDRH